LAWTERAGPLKSSSGTGTISVHLWDRSSPQAHALTIARVYNRFAKLAFYPDSKRLAFLSDKAEIVVWDVTSNQKAFPFGEGEPQWRGWPPPDTCLSADGTCYAIGHQRVTVWDMVARKFLVALPAELTPIKSLAWSPKAELLAAGTANGDLVIWNLPKVNAKLGEMGLGW
jgi:WD40 repeat protein